ncbi:MAG: C40 family peptidase [Clostridium sp.]|nr:C40 family peptidase [Clostridium sp.]
MRHFILSIIIMAGAVFSTKALSTPEPAATIEFEASASDDFLMPSLAEMLGEKVDDFGEFDINAELKESLVDYAKKYVGTRYRRGAKGPTAFDCSGFTSYIFRNFGYTLSPASSLQGIQGEPVSMSEVEVGDLMFFSGRRGGKTVGHVGMVVDVDRETGAVKFIHASTSRGVVIDNYPDGGYYSKRFLHARRVLGEAEELASAE